MSQDLLKSVVVIAIVAILICLIMAALATVGAITISDGCFKRYNVDDNNNITNADSITNTITLRADSNYTAINTTSAEGTLTISRDPIHYDDWLNTNLAVEDGQEINLKITGEVSLCRAYLPKNNLGSSNNVDNNNKGIPIPRVDDQTSLPLIFSAQIGEWRNITEMYRNDKIQVFLGRDGDITAQDIFKGQLVKASPDCADGRATYDPVCGRFSPYNGLKYPVSCSYTCNLKQECRCAGTWAYSDSYHASGTCVGTSYCGSVLIGQKRYNKDTATIGITQKTAIGPNNYNSNGGDFIANANILNSAIVTNLTCSGPGGTKAQSWAMGDDDYNFYLPNGTKINDDNLSPPSAVSNICTNFPQNFPTAYSDPSQITQPPPAKFWCSANDACGILYRFDTNETPTNAKTQGSISPTEAITPGGGFWTAKIIDTTQRSIFDTIYIAGDSSFLQYRLYDQSITTPNNTGGYVFSIKHTKCRRTNGGGITDPAVTNRGQVQYIITSDNPNSSAGTSYSPEGITVDGDGNAKITVPSKTKGYLWMRIYNDQADYSDSSGQYTVQFMTSKSVGQFTVLILTPLFKGLTDMIAAASQQVFKNMTCYNGGGSEYSSCINFFNYIKALLSLYIMVYGMMFLAGMVQINQQDLVIRVIKIGIVAGLMNGSTFDFFNNYVFNFVTGFSSGIISNMSGYSMFSTSNTITNPFMFMDALMSKIFFSTTFYSQLLALISLGLSGMLYFIIVIIALVVLIMTTFKAIAIYLMALLSVAVLIGLAPLFLTFMLFDFTRYLFDNWVRFTFRYMIEPVVLMAGIIILTQLFTIYLDYAIGYSVCWKCALPIKIPFIGTILPVALLNVPMFCINWFAPWGLDTNTGTMGINLQHMIALVIIAYCMNGYAELSSKMVVKLTGTAGPSATSSGIAMADHAGKKVSEFVSSKMAGDEKSKSKSSDDDDKGSKRKGISNENKGGSAEDKTSTGDVDKKGAEKVLAIKN